MNEEERKKLACIMSLLRDANGVFDITLGPEECSILVKYIDYLRDLNGD